MIVHRPWASLDKGDYNWLRAGHHFQVGPAGNPAHQALGALIVWNDDEIAVGTGFPLHGHRDMEIVTYVRQGVLGHRDSLGHESAIQAGDVQVMSAGTGIRHAEFNKGEVALKLYQIWLLPREKGGAPRWGTRTFPKGERSGRFAVLPSGFADDKDALPIRANARLLGATLKAGENVRQHLGASNRAYLVVASGRVVVDGKVIGPRDGAVISNSVTVDVLPIEDSELVMVEAG